MTSITMNIRSIRTMRSLSISYISSVLAFLFCFCLCLAEPSFAKDFGKQGTTFVVKEEGFVAMIKRKLGDLNLEKHQQKMQDIARDRVFSPPPVRGIERCKKQSSHIFDPTFVLDKDVYLPCGKLLYAAGTKVNPLDQMDFTSELVFIDGSDKAQVAFVKERYLSSVTKPASAPNSSTEVSVSGGEALYHGDTKIILVAGRPLDLAGEIGVHIYFDQFGELTTKFGIKSVPAIVKQEGKHLKVTEVRLDDDGALR